MKRLKIGGLVAALGIGATFIFSGCKPNPNPTISEVKTQKIAYTSDIDGDDEIFVMNSDGTNNRQLTFNSERNAIAKYNAATDTLTDTTLFGTDYDVTIRDRQTGVIIDRFTEGNTGYDGNGEISPDGNYMTWRRGTKIYVQDLEKTFTPILISDGLDLANAPAWSPDGKRIFMEGYESGETLRSIYQVVFDNPYDFSNRSLSKLSLEDTVENMTPDVHPTEQFVTYVSGGNLVEQDYVTKDIRTIRDSVEDIWLPSYSPSGEKLTFSFGILGLSDIGKVGRDGNGFEEIAKTSANEYAPTWFEYSE